MLLLTSPATKGTSSVPHPSLPKRVNSDLTPDNGIGSTPQTVRITGNCEPKVTGAAQCDAER